MPFVAQRPAHPPLHKADVDRPGHHLRPILIVLAFLLPTVYLTIYYSDKTQVTPFVPSSILVLGLLNVDIILLVLLILLLSRNLVKAFFERRQRLLGSGFRTKLIAAFIGFTLIPSLLLVGLAGGLLSQSIDHWFGQEVEHALKDSQDVVQAHREGHQTRTLYAARAISREIYADGLLTRIITKHSRWRCNASAWNTESAGWRCTRQTKTSSAAPWTPRFRFIFSILPTT